MRNRIVFPYLEKHDLDSAINKISTIPYDTKVQIIHERLHYKGKFPGRGFTLNPPPK